MMKKENLLLLHVVAGTTGVPILVVCHEDTWAAFWAEATCALKLLAIDLVELEAAACCTWCFLLLACAFL